MRNIHSECGNECEGSDDGKFGSSEDNDSSTDTSASRYQNRDARISKLSKESQHPSLISQQNKKDYKRSILFSGNITAKKVPSTIDSGTSIVRREEYSIPVPVLSVLIKQRLHRDLIEFIWQEFLNFDTDESELLLFKHTKSIIGMINEAFFMEISIENLNFQETEDDDYIEFKEFAGKLSEYLMSIDYGSPHVAEPKMNDSSNSCSKFASEHSGMVISSDIDVVENARSSGNRVVRDNPEGFGGDDIKYQSIFWMEKSRDERHYLLRIAYSEFSAARNGVVRNKDIVKILDKINVKYDRSKVPFLLIELYEDFHVPSFKTFLEIVVAITDDDTTLVGGSLDLNLEDSSSHSALPQWLSDHFMPVEILMFKHYYCSPAFTLQGGNLSDKVRESDECTYVRDNALCDFRQSSVASNYNDKESSPAVILRLRGILNHMGADVSEQEAIKILSVACSKIVDGETLVTLNFVTFVTLLFKISNGTVRNFEIKNSLFVLKSNLKIFEEIHALTLDAVQNVKFKSFRGQPVDCDFVLSGPSETPYEGGTYAFRVTVTEGYPYACPSVLFLTRTMSINIFNKIDGTGLMPHLIHVWDVTWNLRKLLKHIVSLFIEPDLSLIPSKYVQIAVACAYLKFKLEAEEGGDMMEGADMTVDTQRREENEDIEIEWGNNEEKGVVPEECPILNYLLSILPSSVPVDKEILERSTPQNIENKLQRFTTLENMHISTLCLYLYDSSEYSRTVRSIVKSFSMRAESHRNELNRIEHDYKHPTTAESQEYYR